MIVDKVEVDKKLAEQRDVTVVFIKNDGSERVMHCTLDMKNVPEKFHPKGTSTKAPNPDIKVVFDTEAQGWRSFKYASVISIS